jgi:hypothetical protein
MLAARTHSCAGHASRSEFPRLIFPTVDANSASSRVSNIDQVNDLASHTDLAIAMALHLA